MHCLLCLCTAVSSAPFKWVDRAGPAWPVLSQQSRWKLLEWGGDRGKSEAAGEEGMMAWADEREWADLAGERGAEGVPGCHCCRCCLWIFTQGCTWSWIHQKAWSLWPKAEKLHHKIMIINKIKHRPLLLLAITVGHRIYFPRLKQKLN